MAAWSKRSTFSSSTGRSWYLRMLRLEKIVSNIVIKNHPFAIKNQFSH
jgi:hypothetical protein